MCHILLERSKDQHFLFFLQCFQKAAFPGTLKVEIVWYRVKAETKTNAECGREHNIGFEREQIDLEHNHSPLQSGALFYE